MSRYKEQSYQESFPESGYLPTGYQDTGYQESGYREPESGYRVNGYNMDGQSETDHKGSTIIQSERSIPRITSGDEQGRRSTRGEMLPYVNSKLGYKDSTSNGNVAITDESSRNNTNHSNSGLYS